MVEWFAMFIRQTLFMANALLIGKALLRFRSINIFRNSSDWFSGGLACDFGGLMVHD
jgi:hypothetical protein